MNLLFIVGLTLNVIAACDILFYRRNGARFKRHISIFAYLLLIVLVFDIFRYTTAIGLMFPVSMSEIIWQSILCILIIRNGGNVSWLLPELGYEIE